MIKFIQVILLCIIIFLALFINLYPNYNAFIKTPTGYDFSGQASWFDPWDINVYVSAIKWGQSGNILLENLYTSLPNRKILIYPVYTIIGWLFPQTQPFLLFYISAILFGLVFSVLSGIFLKVFLKSTPDSILALFLFIFGGGFGWLFLNKIKSADLYMTGFTSISQIQRPHEALGLIIYISALVLFYLACVKKSFIFNFFSVGFLLFLTFLYPYYYLSYFVICGIYSLLKYLREAKKIYLKFIALNLLISAPALIFYYQHLNTNTTFGSILSQQLSTPNLPEVLLGYGILIIFVFLQLKSKENRDERLFLNLWFFLSLLLSYFPFGFSRFYLRGLFFPLVILSIYGFHIILNKYKYIRYVLILMLIFIVPLSTFYMFKVRIEETQILNPWFYQPKEVKLILKNIPQELPYKNTVLTSYNMGNYIPAHSNLRVYFGHLIQTPNSDEKIINLTKFYGNVFTDSEAQKFLELNNIQYIWFGPEEKAITVNYSGNQILKYSFLIPIFEVGDIVVLKYNF